MHFFTKKKKKYWWKRSWRSLFIVPYKAGVQRRREVNELSRNDVALKSHANIAPCCQASGNYLTAYWEELAFASGLSNVSHRRSNPLPAMFREVIRNKKQNSLLSFFLFLTRESRVIFPRPDEIQFSIHPLNGGRARSPRARSPRPRGSINSARGTIAVK